MSKTCRHCQWCEVSGEKRTYDRCTHPETEGSLCFGNCDPKNAEATCTYFQQYVPPPPLRRFLQRHGILLAIIIGGGIICCVLWYFRPDNTKIELLKREWECVETKSARHSSTTMIGGKVPMTTYSTSEDCVNYRWIGAQE